jgi:hypothetical protein
MNTYVILVSVFFLFVVPKSVNATNERYEEVSKLTKEDKVLYAKEVKFEDIGFGSIIDYEVINKNLMVRVSGQITPAMFVGDIIITYEYRDKMYQAKAIEFITDMNKNPFYGLVKH